jgi:hypothetical protein
MDLCPVGRSASLYIDPIYRPVVPADAGRSGPLGKTQTVFYRSVTAVRLCACFVPALPLVGDRAVPFGWIGVLLSGAALSRS